MNRIYTAAYALQQFCMRQGWSFCFIGGIAVQRWGQPRLTRDADLTLLVEFGTEDAFIDALLDQFASRVPDARVFARATRVLLLRAVNRVALDVALGATPFEEQSIPTCKLVSDQSATKTAHLQRRRSDRA